jgi:uncharacterized protein YjbI with pentapeptide repeats
MESLYKGLFATLAVLLFAGQCVAAPGTSIVLGATAPGGFLYDGKILWATDGALGFCQVAGGSLVNCIKPGTTNTSVPALLGQPAFDGAFVYLPDKSNASLGIWRYPLTPGQPITSPGVQVAPTAGLGGQQPAAVAYDPADGNLYAVMGGNTSILRIHTPAAASQTVDKMGTTLNGKPATGLAIVGAQLWVAEGDGILLLPDPVGCATKCRGSLDTQIGVTTALSITYDGPRNLVYIGNSTGAFQFNVGTGNFVLYSASYVRAGVAGLYSNVSAVGVDTTGNLYIGDDPTLGQTVGGATLFTVPAGSAPDGLPPQPTAPPTPVPTIFANALANPASQVLNAVLTTPTAAVWMGTHVWVLSAAGFCRVDPGTSAPSLSNCARLPAGVVPGPPAFDKTGNLLYIPDTTAGTAGQGILKLQFNTASETLGPATQVVANSALDTAAGVTTGPTSVAFGPDNQLYVAMGRTANVLRVSAPSSTLHTVKVIGTLNDVGSINMTFFGPDLWAVEKTDASFIHQATLCGGACTATFLGVFFQVSPPAITANSALVYISDATVVWEYDPVANVFQRLVDTGLAGTTSTPFVAVSGLAWDGLSSLYMADTGPLWKSTPSKITLASVVPGVAAAGTPVNVTITGQGLTGGTVNFVSGSGITVGPLTISPAGDQITTTFTVALNASSGAHDFLVSSGAANSNTLSFLVNPGAPILSTLTMTPQPPAPAPSPSIVVGTSGTLNITGSNLTGATLNLPSGVTASGVTTTTTTVSATLTAALTAPQTLTSISVTTVGGGSNALPFSVIAPPPTISSIAPASGVIGTNVAVNIFGTFLTNGTINFPAGSGLSLLSTPITSPNQIAATFIIAPTAPLGPQNITVTTSGGTSLPVVFTVDPQAPVLTSIAPVSGAAGTTFPVVLNGSNLTGANLSGLLGVGITASSVTVNAAGTQINATFTVSLTATQGPAGIFVVTQSTPAGLWTGGASNTVNFTILPPPPPTLTTIAPTSGVTGTTVAATLTGTNLLGASAINAGSGIAVSNLAVVNSTTVTATFTIAANAAVGPQNVTITTPGGTSAVPVVFTIVPPAPTLTSIAPNSGLRGASVPVTISGTNLTGATLSTGANITATGVTVSANSITATFALSATASGPQNITVTTAGGTSSAVVFTITLPGPSLTSVSPASGVQGATLTGVTLTGTNFLSGATLVTSANITASAVQVVSSTQITATFLLGAAGPATVSVSTAGGTSTALPFTINPLAPTLTGISPVSGVQGTSVFVTLTGTNLQGASSVSAGPGIAVSNLGLVNATTVTATFTIGAATVGPQNVTITTPGGTSSPVTFTVLPPGPVLTSIAPNSGVQGTSVPVTISGSNLSGAVLNLPAGIKVATGTTPLVTATTITSTLAIDPAAATGTVGINVTTAGGTSNSLPFTINPPAPR